jgi:hypothetical protein
VAGKVIASATWNSIFTDLSTALTELGSGTTPILGLVVTPAATTTNQGLSITQTGPITGTQSTQLNFNLITVNSDQAGITSSSLDANALYIQYSYGGTNTQGGRQGLFVSTSLTAATSNSSTNKAYVAGSFLQTASANDGGTNTGGGSLGAHTAISGFVNAQAAATNYKSFMGCELDVQMLASSSAMARFGISLVSFGAVNGATYDAALEIGASSAGTVAWNNGILFSQTWNGHQPISSTGTAFITEGSYTIGSVIDFSTVTITNYLLRSANFSIDGSGDLTSSGGFGSFGGSVLAQTGLAMPGGGTTSAGFRMTSTSNFGLFGGSGAPTLSAAQGSIYLQNDGYPWVNLNASTSWSPISSTVKAPVIVTVSTQTMGVGDAAYIFTTSSTLSPVTLTLPSASLNSGRILKVLNQAPTAVVSAASNVVLLAGSGGSPGTPIIVSTSGKFAVLIAASTYWQVTEAN